MKVNVLALLLLIFSIGCGEDVDTIDLEVISADGQYLHSWGGYHWNSNHLSPTVVDKTKSTLYNVTGMIAEWNGLNTPIQPVLTASMRRCRPRRRYAVFCRLRNDRPLCLTEFCLSPLPRVCLLHWWCWCRKCI